MIFFCTNTKISSFLFTIVHYSIVHCRKAVSLGPAPLEVKTVLENRSCFVQKNSKNSYKNIWIFSNPGLIKYQVNFTEKHSG